MKWRQLNTPKFQLIYPASEEKDAQRMANTVNAIIGRVSNSYGQLPKKISVILQNQGTSANGFVQLAPRRSEFFTTPSQEFDDQDWLNSLAVHELRHVVQFDRLTGKLSAPFEGLALAIFGITLPPWFYEGDAVGIETSLTAAGRGRQPEFDLILRTNTLSGRKYSYSKDYLGSLKNFTAGYYPLGFFMTTKLRRDAGPKAMDSLFSDLTRHPLRPYNLSRGIRTLAGFSTATLHTTTIAEMERVWEQTREKAATQSYPILNRRKQNYPVNYYLPVSISPGKIAALKRGPGVVPALVILDSTGHEHTLRKIGVQEDPYFRYAAGKFVWDEFRYDKRFQKRSYNVILLYDQSTGQTRQLTHKTRLFAPCLSPDGKTLAAIAVDYANTVSVVLYDLLGKELKRFKVPENTFLQTPAFSPGGEKLVMTGVSDQGKTLLELDLNSSVFTRLFPYVHRLLSKPAYFGDHTVIFKDDINGIDNLVSFDKQAGQFFKLTSAAFGAYNPAWDEKNERILFNNYGPDGFDIAYIRSAAVNVVPLSDSDRPAVDYIQPVTVQEGNTSVFDSIPSRSYSSRPYRELGNLLNFHSLVPILEQNDIYNDLNAGVKLQSDNKLNTLSLYMGYRFNNALKKNEYLAGITYSKFYPVVTLSYLNEARLYVQQQQLGGTVINTLPTRWREHTFEARIALPFTFNANQHVFTSRLEAGTSYITRYQFSAPFTNLATRLKFPLFYRLAFGHNTLRSARDLASAWGQNFSLLYRYSPLELALKGHLLTFQSDYSFPGIFTNHSFTVSVNAQGGTGNYRNILDIPTINGYASVLPAGPVKNTVLSAYRFPIAYPDWEIGPLAYVKRISGGVFADFQNVFNPQSGSPHSYGFELKADLNLLRFYLPDFTVGSKIIFINRPFAKSPVVEAGLTYSY